MSSPSRAKALENETAMERWLAWLADYQTQLGTSAEQSREGIRPDAPIEG